MFPRLLKFNAEKLCSIVPIDEDERGTSSHIHKSYNTILSSEGRKIQESFATTEKSKKKKKRKTSFNELETVLDRFRRRRGNSLACWQGRKMQEKNTVEEVYTEIYPTVGCEGIAIS